MALFFYVRKASAAEAQLSEADHHLKEQLHKLNSLQQELAVNEEKLRSEQQKLDRLRGLEEKLEAAEIASRKNDAELVRMSTQLEEAKEQRQKWEEEVLTMRKQLKSEFENLANRIFESSSNKLSETNDKQVKQIIAPLMENIGEFKKKVVEVYDKESRERISLSHQIEGLKELNKKIEHEAFRLTNALKGDNKQQGNWGEMILEKVLETSGLQKDREYFTQGSFTNEEGKLLRPDVIVSLPGERSIVIDAKVSLVAYQRYCDAEDEGEKAQALKEHIASIEAHVSGLSQKKYEDLPEIKTLDYVLLFLPIEAAFLKAMESAPELYQKAYDKNIVLVCPSTLMVTLRTVENIWRFEKQNINALEIANRAGKLHDQLATVLETMVEHGKQLKKAEQSYEKMIKQTRDGQGNLVRQVEMLEELGAKANKKLALPSEED